MPDIKQLANDKAEAFTNAVTSDSRWKIDDELMCQVFGFTLYGYIFGIGRVFYFMDFDDIQKLVADKLSGLGIGLKYATGLVKLAHQEFIKEGNTSLHSRLISIGHSHFASESVSELVESVFVNTERIRSSLLSS